MKTIARSCPSCCNGYGAAFATAKPTITSHAVEDVTDGVATLRCPCGASQRMRVEDFPPSAKEAA